MSLCTVSRGLTGCHPVAVAGCRPRLVAVLLGMSGILPAAWCAADTGPLNYTLYLQSFDPAQPNATTVKQADVLPGGLKTDITNAWNGYVALARPRILQTVQQADWVKKGYTLSNARLAINGIDSIDVVEMNPAGTSTIPPIDASHPMIVIRSTQARLDADSTTDIPGYPNPSFHVTFDMTVNVHLGIGPMATQVTVAGADVQFANAAYFPDNAAAHLGSVIDTLRSIFGVQSIAARVAQGINSSNINITDYIRKYVQRATVALTGQYVKNGWVGAGIFLDQTSLSFVVQSRGIPNSNGRMTGTLTVVGPQANAGVAPGSASCTGIFKVHDTVQTQPPYVATLVPLRFLSATPPTQTLDANISVTGGSPAAAPSGYSCQYNVAGLAQGYANNIGFVTVAAGGVSGGSVTLASGVTVSFSACPAVAGAVHAATGCLQHHGCGSPLEVPAGGASCDLVGQVTVSGSSAALLQQSMTAHPAISRGDPAQRSGVVTAPVWQSQPSTWNPAAGGTSAAPASRALAKTPSWSTTPGAQATVTPVQSALGSRGLQPGPAAAPAAASSSLQTGR